jgi:hypothetical protein
MAEAQQVLGQQAAYAREQLVAQSRQLLMMRSDARGFEAAIDNASDSLKRNGRTLDIHTAKGRANQEALDQIASTTLAWRDASVKAGHSVKEQDKIMADGRSALIKTATQMGLTKAAARRLADEILGIPTVKNIDIHIRTFGNLKEAMAAGRFNDNTSSGGRAHGGIVGAFASGGTVPRAGSILVGEQGPEILEGVPAGSRVRTAGETRQILSGGGGGVTRLEIEWVGGNAGDEFISWLRKNIRVRGGSVQGVLGVPGRA